MAKLLARSLPLTMSLLLFTLSMIGPEFEVWK